MDGFNIGKILPGIISPEYLKKLQSVEQGKTFLPDVNSALNNAPKPNQMLQSLETLASLTQSLKMNTLAGMDKSVFIRNLLGLPQNFTNFIMSLQNIAKLQQAPNNPELAAAQNPVLAEIFDEMQPQNPAQNKDITNLIFNGMVSLPEISKLIIENGKQAIAGLIIAMASASKQGMSNEQIQEMLGIINTCVTLAESDNPAYTLKSLMLLYLPWLPLNEGVGFDLEVTPQAGENESNDSRLTVLIQTKNFGNIKGVFTLTTSNSVDVYILCSESFPKATLQRALSDELSSHSMNMNIDIEQIKPVTEEENETRETKVNLSATNEINPYLLLAAHTFIRNTILIDNNP